MKALSLWQPWASAIIRGHKRIETRGWDTKQRGALLIHAALRVPTERRLLRTVFAGDDVEPPLGCLLGVVDLVAVEPTERLRLTLDPVELGWGDYSDHRFGFVLENIRVFAQPIVYRGRQKLFEVPESVFANQRESQ